MREHLDLDRTIRRPYGQVGLVAAGDPLVLIGRRRPPLQPTTAAIPVVLRVDLVHGVTIVKAVRIRVGTPRRGNGILTRPISIRAARIPWLFPRLDGELRVVREGPATKIAIEGDATVPLGLLGALLHRRTGHRLMVESMQSVLNTWCDAIEAEVRRDERERTRWRAG